MTVIGLVAGALGCGTIEGDVYLSDSTDSRVPDVDVLLVKQSDSFLESLKKFCLDEKADEARRNFERKRLEGRFAALKDSAAVIFGLEYKSPRWQRLANAANAASDSSAQLSIAGADPVTLAEQTALQRARTDSNGHYRLSDVRFGRYYVVPVMRESEYSPVQWYPTRVVLGTKRLDATSKDGWAGCYLTAMDSLEGDSRR
jgi:hypothetical protein